MARAMHLASVCAADCGSSTEALGAGLGPESGPDGARIRDDCSVQASAPSTARNAARYDLGCEDMGGNPCRGRQYVDMSAGRRLVDDGFELLPLPTRRLRSSREVLRPRVV